MSRASLRDTFIVIILGLAGAIPPGPDFRASAEQPPARAGEAATEKIDGAAPTVLDSDDPSLAGRFRGQVTGPDGKPFRGARIYARPASDTQGEAGRARAVTDGDGRFEFDAPDLTTIDLDGLPARTRCLVFAMADGYAPDWAFTRGRSSSRSAPAPLPEIALQLGKADVPIQGRFLDPEGRPLADARVQLSRLMVPRWRDLDRHLEIEEGQLLSSVDYERELPHPQLIAGLPIETRTGANGWFTLEGVGSERLAMLRVSAPGVVDTELKVMTRFAPDVGILRDPQGNPTRAAHGSGFTVTLEPGLTVRGRVIDRNSRKPIAGMWVGKGHAAMDGLRSGVWPTVTDAEGWFEITGVDRRVWEWKDSFRTFVAVPSPGQPYAPASGVLKPDEPLVIECVRGIPFRLKVVDEQGRPVEAEVTYRDVQPNPDTKSDGRWPLCRAARRGDGSYEGFVLPGPGAVLVKSLPGSNHRPAHVNPKAFFAPGRTIWTPQEQISAYGTHDTLSTGQGWTSQHDYSAIVLVNPGKSTERLELSATVVADTSRQVTLVDSEGKPVAGAMPHGLTFHPWDSERLLRAASFPLKGLHPDRLQRITFLKKDRQLIGFLGARGDGNAPYTVRMQPWATITGKLVDENGAPLSATISTGGSGIVIEQDPEVGQSAGARSDKKGNFRIDKLIPGLRYTGRIYGKANRRPRLVFQDLILQPGENRDLGMIRIAPPAFALAPR